MATLLHLDSAVFPQGSASRDITAAFVEAWREQHPDGTVVHRDLAADPLPHLDSKRHGRGRRRPAAPGARRRAGGGGRRPDRGPDVQLHDPVHPQGLARPGDHRRAQRGTGLPVAGTPVTVVASRGGSYAPGTPRESFEFVQNYLEKVFAGMFSIEVDFIVPELTLAPSQPSMAELIPLAEASRAKALDDAREKAKALATRLAA